ncbi:MAG: Crp/Fnr family transcriptional regulator [Clostridiales bacterium]|nr:Crp/Fnr family transcriptional regulator [Clostridiales bacterium]
MLEYIKGISLFNGTDYRTIERLIDRRQIYVTFYHKGMTVHEQKTKSVALDIICSGGLTAYSLAPNGSETVVFEFGTGSIIGANLLFGDQNLYPMSIYCTEDSSLLHVTKAGVETLLKEYAFVMEFVRSLSLNAQGMNQRIAMYTQKSLRDNLRDYLHDLSKVQNSNTIILPITKKQLADYLGVQRPSLFRELKKMKDEDLIDVNNRNITIKFL